jgi:hypothetical protein
MIVLVLKKEASYIIIKILDQPSDELERFILFQNLKISLWFIIAQLKNTHTVVRAAQPFRRSHTAPFVLSSNSFLSLFPSLHRFAARSAINYST